MSKRHRDTKRARQGTESGITATFTLDEDDARELERHAKRLGVSVDTLLNEAIAKFNRDVSGEPPSPSMVEYLAQRGRKILRKRDLN